MNKFIIPDIKKLRKKYRLRFLGGLIPFIQFNLVVVLMAFINKKYLSNDFPPKILKICLIVGCSATFIYCLSAFLLCHSLIKSHKKNTFIDVLSNFLIISCHKETVINRFKNIYYKNIYIIKLSELKSITLKKRKIIITGKIRMINDKADRLHYTTDEKGNIKFDVWWYNYNSTAELEKIDIHDVYNNSPRVLKMIRHACSFEKARLENRRKYHEQMLRLAKAPIRRERRPRTEIFKNK